MEKIKLSPKKETIGKITKEDEPMLTEIAPETDEEAEERRRQEQAIVNGILEEEDKADADWDTEWERHEAGGVN